MKSYSGPVLIRREIWEFKNLTRTEKHLLSLIDNLAKKNGCFASNYYLAIQLKVKEKTIANLKYKLRKEKYLKKIKNIDGKILHILHPDFEQKLSFFNSPKNPKKGNKQPLERKKPSFKKEHISKRKRELKNSSKQIEINSFLEKEKFTKQEKQNLFNTFSFEEILEGVKNYYFDIQRLRKQGKTWTKGLLFYKIKEAKQNLSIKKLQYEEHKKKNKNILKEDYILNHLELPENFRLDIRELIKLGKGIQEIQIYFKDTYNTKKEIIIA